MKTKVHATLRKVLLVVVTLILVPVTTNVQAQGYPSGMVSYWRLDEGSGTIANDSVGGNDATIEGPTWTTGLVGGALSFDGVDDRAVKTDFATSGLVDEGTIEAWVKLGFTPPEGAHGIAGIGNSPNWCNYPSEADKLSYRLLHYGDHVSIQNGPCGPAVMFSTAGLQTDVWYHIAGTWDRNLGRLQIFLNGELQAESSGLELGTVLNDGLYIGVTPDVNHWYFDGLIDEVAVSSRPLATEEIQQHYQNGLNGLGYDLLNLITAIPDNTQVYPGDIVTVDLPIEEGNDLYALEMTCSVSPTILAAQEGVLGNLFAPTSRYVVVNSVNAGEGTWDIAVSLLRPAEPIFGDGLFATLTYQALSPGVTSITCEVLLSDRDGFDLPVSFVGTEVTVLPYATIEGQVERQGREGNHLDIDVTAEGPFTYTAATVESGDFAFSELRAAAGQTTAAYTVTADAPQYLPSCESVEVTLEATTVLSMTILRGGDVNDDDVINIGDATLLGNNFGLDVPPGDTAADINADGVVNVQDLAILGGNYELSGCQSW